MARGDALRHRHIQANPHALANLLVVDCDHQDAHARGISATGSHPMPNAIVENPRNGHAHLVWALLEPVTKTERAHLKPLAYAASVTEGLRRALDGDAGYSGLMTKNPLHVDWAAEWFTDELYSLDQIAHSLGSNLPPFDWRKHHDVSELSGLGRNCSLFETSRHWAYREVRHWLGDAAGFARAIEAGVQERNLAFAEPLPVPEANGVARSITKWITTRSRMWNEVTSSLSPVNQRRRKKSAELRRRFERENNGS